MTWYVTAVRDVFVGLICGVSTTACVYADGSAQVPVYALVAVALGMVGCLLLREVEE